MLGMAEVANRIGVTIPFKSNRSSNYNERKQTYLKLLNGYITSFRFDLFAVYAGIK